jgi:hypothetical protein
MSFSRLFLIQSNLGGKIACFLKGVLSTGGEVASLCITQENPGLA